MNNLDFEVQNHLTYTLNPQPLPPSPILLSFLNSRPFFSQNFISFHFFFAITRNIEFCCTFYLSYKFERLNIWEGLISFAIL